MADNVYSFVHYVGDGTTRNFSVPFDYLDQDHVVVKVDGEDASFEWLDSNTIRLSEAPPSGIVIEVRRETSHESRRVIFHDGSVLTEDDLNAAVIHTFYMAQEAVDLARNTLLLTPTGEISARGRRLTDLADPQDPQDAATKGYVDTIADGVEEIRNQAEWFKDRAEEAAIRAEYWSSKEEVQVQHARQGSATLNAGQTQVHITYGYWHETTLVIWLNGVKLRAGVDYEAPGPSYIHLLQPALEGDILEWLILDGDVPGEITDAVSQAEAAAQEAADSAQEAADAAADSAKKSQNLSDLTDLKEARANLGTFASVAEVQSRHIPPVLESIEVSGYRYNSVSSEPSHPGKVQDASGRWFELAEAVARPQMFGARGDGSTDDQSALEAAVNFALLTGAEIYWPNGAYVSTGNIPNFHSVSHTGPGVLVRGSDTYHVQPKVLDNNTLYVSPSGTGDGLSSSHPMSAAAARTALMNYGPFIDGVWVIRFAAGVYEGVTLTFNQRFQSRWPLVLEGPDVGGHPNEPTAVFDGTGESDWFCRASDGVRIRVNNIKVINYTQSGAFTSTRARMALVNVHMDNVIHGVSSIHQSNISVSGGVWTGMGKEVFGDGLKTVYGSSFGVSGHNSPSDGTIIQNFQRGVAGLDAASSGHIDYITVQNCGTGLFFNRGGGANCTGVRVWNNDLGLYAGSGTFSLLTSSADFGVGTPNANTVKQRIEAGAIDWSRLSGSLSESQIASATIPAHTGTTSETVLWTPWTIRAGDVSEGRGDTLRLNAWGSGPALAEDAMLRLRLSGDTVISISIPAGSTTWEVEFIVRFTSGSGQRNLVKRFSGASPGINYITSSVDMQVDRDVELSCTLGDASDSVTLRTVTLYATMYGG